MLMRCDVWRGCWRGWIATLYANAMHTGLVRSPISCLDSLACLHAIPHICRTPGLTAQCRGRCVADDGEGKPWAFPSAERSGEGK